MRILGIYQDGDPLRVGIEVFEGFLHVVGDLVLPFHTFPELLVVAYVFSHVLDVGRDARLLPEVDPVDFPFLDLELFREVGLHRLEVLVVLVLGEAEAEGDDGERQDGVLGLPVYEGFLEHFVQDVYGEREGDSEEEDERDEGQADVPDHDRERDEAELHECLTYFKGKVNGPVYEGVSKGEVLFEFFV